MIVHLVDRSKKRLFLLIVLKHFGKFVVVFVFFLTMC